MLIQILKPLINYHLQLNEDLILYQEETIIKINLEKLNTIILILYSPRLEGVLNEKIGGIK